MSDDSCILTNLYKCCSVQYVDLYTFLFQVHLSKQSAASKMKNGLGKTIQEELVVKLKSTPFSLNIDEASSDHGKKILSMLASYFDETSGSIEVHHFASVEVIKADAQTLFQTIVDVF